MHEWIILTNIGIISPLCLIVSIYRTCKQNTDMYLQKCRHKLKSCIHESNSDQWETIIL